MHFSQCQNLEQEQMFLMFLILNFLKYCIALFLIVFLKTIIYMSNKKRPLTSLIKAQSKLKKRKKMKQNHMLPDFIIIKNELFQLCYGWSLLVIRHTCDIKIFMKF